MEPAVIGVVGTLAGTVVGGLGAYVNNVRTGKDAAARQSELLMAERERLELELQHERQLSELADLRQVLDDCIASPTRIVDAYIRAITFMGLEEHQLNDAMRNEKVEATNAFVHQVFDWRRDCARASLSLEPGRTLARQSMVNFEMLLQELRERTTMDVFDEAFTHDESLRILDRMRELLHQMELTAYYTVHPEIEPPPMDALD